MVLSVQSLMVNPLNYFSFQPVLHDWSNKGCGMCYPVCKMMHIKESLLLSHVVAVGFFFHYLSGPLPYVRRHITVNNVLSVSLNKTFPSFHEVVAVGFLSHYH